MIIKKDIIAMARHIVRRNAGYPDRRIMHPVRDWFIGVMMAVVLLVFVSVGAVWIFLTKSTIAADDYRAEHTPIAYDVDRIKKVLEMYAAQQEEFDILRADRESVPEGLRTEPENEIGADGSEDIRLRVE